MKKNTLTKSERPGGWMFVQIITKTIYI